MAFVRVYNVTNFFNRELFMYSLGDIKFKKPIPLKKVAFITLFLIVWAIPIYFLIGVKFNPFFFAFWLGIPIAAGTVASRPVFGGKGLVDFVKTLMTYLGEPKGWTDFNPTNTLEEDTYYIEQEIWVSRRRELALLEALEEQAA